MRHRARDQKGCEMTVGPVGVYWNKPNQRPEVNFNKLNIFKLLAEISGSRKVRKNQGKLLAHGLQKFLIIFGSMHLILQEFHRFNHA
jgi:hypothetical protein